MTKKKLKVAKKASKLKKPTKKMDEPYWDYHEVSDYLEKLHKKNFRDYAGKFTAEGKIERDAQIKAWVVANGYSGWEHAMDVPDPAKPRDDWPADSEEMKKRVEINLKMWPDLKKTERPYQDFWHFIVENNEVTNGCWIYLPEQEVMDDPDVEPWQKEILQYFMDFLGDDYNERMWAEW